MDSPSGTDESELVVLLTGSEAKQHNKLTF